jgi:hypothetical protein
MAKLAAGKIKVVAIIASLAALALVLSPTFSLIPIPGSNAASVKAAAEDSFSDEAVFKPDDTVVEDVSEEDLAACNSLNTSLDNILGVDNSTRNDRKVASDLLLAEFCSRPTLIHEIMSTDYQSLTLVAYACDASAGKIGTEAIQESLSEHYRIYCDSARVLILNESNTFLATVEEFRTTYIPILESGFEDDGPDSSASNGTETEASSNFNATEARAALDKVEESLNHSIELVYQFEYYEAAKSFDNASKIFIAIFAEEE